MAAAGRFLALRCAPAIGRLGPSTASARRGVAGAGESSSRRVVVLLLQVLAGWRPPFPHVRAPAGARRRMWRRARIWPNFGQFWPRQEAALTGGPGLQLGCGEGRRFAWIRPDARSGVSRWSASAPARLLVMCFSRVVEIYGFRGGGPGFGGGGFGQGAVSVWSWRVEGSRGQIGVGR